MGALIGLLCVHNCYVQVECQWAFLGSALNAWPLEEQKVFFSFVFWCFKSSGI